MKCVNCGKKIPNGTNKLCSDCQKKLVQEIKDEEYSESPNRKNIDTGKFSVTEMVFMIACIVVIVVSISTSAIAIIKRKLEISKSNFSTTDAYLGNTIGNTIGNIRYYGFCAKQGDWIYYYAANEDFSEGRICRTKVNGAGKSVIFKQSDTEIYSINAINDYIFFTGITKGAYSTIDSVDNKIYRMKNDGSNIEVINDNGVSNENYFFYVIKDKIYYVGMDENIYKMNLDGSNIEKISDYATGFLGVTEKYIIFDKIDEIDGTNKQVTYIMNLDGTEARAVLNNEKLYHVNIDNDYVYYLDVDQNICKTKIDSGKSEVIYSDAAVLLNVYNNNAYFFNYTNSEKETRVGIYKVSLTGKDHTPQLIKVLSSTSYYIDVVGEYANFLDRDTKNVTINLLKTDGSLKNTVLFTYPVEDVQKYYGQNSEE